MKGLIKKDILLSKGMFKNYLIIILAFAFASYLGQTDLLLSFLPFLGLMIVISTLSYDQYYKWDAFALTLPITRKNVIKAKYFLAVGLMLCFTFIAAILSILIAMINHIDLQMIETISVVSGSLLGTTLAISILLPAMYKFGSENGRIVLFTGIFLGFIFVSIIAELLKDYLNASLFTDAIYFISTFMIPIQIILVFLLPYLSYLICLKIYHKKEF